MASKKAASKKGKRYSVEQKQEVVDFAIQHNEQNRRGGAAAASKKFGVSQLTVGSWLKSSTPLSGKAKTKGSKKEPKSGTVSVILSGLSKLDAQILAKRKELAGLEAQFQQLKASL